jgi:hypothetical protein
VNFVGHIATGLVARDGGVRHGAGDPPPDTTFLLGTALPDFAAMARLRLDRVGGPLGRGMQLHHDTDAVFHREGWFLDLEHELLADLVAAGLPRGGALACAHVGVELLLDGELLQNSATATAVMDVYAMIAQPPDAAIVVAPFDARMRWAEHLSGIASRLDPFLYADPISVAQRLHRITESRPRLAFESHHIPTIASRLAELQPRIARSAPEVLARVSVGVAAGVSAR